MKQKLVFILELLIAVAAPGAWLLMVFHNHSDFLSSSGLASLRYFTVLSNLLAGFSALVYIFSVFRRGVSHWVVILNLISTTAVALTFLTVFSFLGPLYGYQNMLRGSNLWLHLLIPVTAVLSFCLMNIDPLPLYAARWPLFCPLIYGTLYYINIVINGLGTWPHSNDWYGFMRWGTPVGFLIFAFILLLDGLAALGLIGLHNFLLTKARRDQHGKAGTSSPR